jgi:DNA-binding PadR family transcriptional regulator
MPRKAEEAYTITYAVLGFLARWGATSGYDLKLWFERGMGNVWEATHSQIYNELRRLQRNGWADMETEEQESRPDRKVYRITKAGRAALAEWLKRPADTPRIHDELALKTVLGGVAPKGALLSVLQAATQAHQQRLAELQEEQRAHGDPNDKSLWQESIKTNNPRDPYVGLVVELGIEFEEMYLRWLHDALTRIEAQHKTGNA